MRLVKDLIDSGIVYFWVDNDSEKLSPDIATLALAEEWRTRYVHSQYPGDERRKSHIDRRKNRDKRMELDETLFASRLLPHGRRKTDVPVEVDIDQAAEKLKVFYC